MILVFCLPFPPHLVASHRIACSRNSILFILEKTWWTFSKTRRAIALISISWGLACHFLRYIDHPCMYAANYTTHGLFERYVAYVAIRYLLFLTPSDLQMTFHTIHRRTLIFTASDIEALQITLSYFSTSTYSFFSFNSTRYTGSYSSVIRSLHSLLIHRLIVYSCQDDFIHVAHDVLGHLERRRTTRTE